MCDFKVLTLTRISAAPRPPFPGSSLPDRRQKVTRFGLQREKSAELGGEEAGKGDLARFGVGGNSIVSPKFGKP